MIVLDASALLEMLLRTPRGIARATQLLSGSADLAAPDLIDIEVAQVLRRYAHREALSPQRGKAALEDLSAFPITRYPHEPLLQRVWDLRANFTAYDATYVALAEWLNAPLLTCDERIARAPRLPIEAELF